MRWRCQLSLKCVMDAVEVGNINIKVITRKYQNIKRNRKMVCHVPPSGAGRVWCAAVNDKFRLHLPSSLLSRF